MNRPRSEAVVVTRVTADGTHATSDELIVEEPMSIQLDGTLVATTMRTPGHDLELAAGFCFTEGLLGGESIIDVRHCSDDREPINEFNTVTVDTACLAPPPTPRLGNVSSSCGWCGSEQLDELCARLAPLPRSAPFDLDLIAAVPDRVIESQSLFARTGSVHAAAAFSRSGDIVTTREDVGRHNAVDKVIGSMLLDPDVALPAGDADGTFGLFVSGRASIEIVQKAWAAGFAAVVAVSAPTALAVDAARRAELTLAGFVRGSNFNVYAPAPRSPRSDR